MHSGTGVSPTLTLGGSSYAAAGRPASTLPKPAAPALVLLHLSHTVQTTTPPSRRRSLLSAPGMSAGRGRHEADAGPPVCSTGNVSRPCLVLHMYRITRYHKLLPHPNGLGGAKMCTELATNKPPGPLWKFGSCPSVGFEKVCANAKVLAREVHTR